MIIELFDMDVPYTVSIFADDEGNDCIKIESSVNTGDDRSIILDKDGVEKLIRVLNFIKEEI